MSMRREERDFAESRIAGCLLGGAIGDALGAAIEFVSLDTIRSRFGPDGLTQFAAAYGRLGAITDDTQMTLFTAEGLLCARAAHADPSPEQFVDAIGEAYLRWLTTQDGSSVDDCGWLADQPVLRSRRAPGLTCLGALEAGGHGSTSNPLNDSKGCGAVMRAAPIGLLSASTFTVGAETGAVTHGHASGYLSSGALAVIVGDLLRGDALGDAVDHARGELAQWPRHEETLAAIDAAVALAQRGSPSAETVETLGAGWVGEEALSIAIYCALVSSDVHQGLALAVNHSGDSDSTGSIAGNLLGAMHGVDALPSEVLAELEARDIIEEIATDLSLTFIDGLPPSIDRYGDV